MKNAKRIFAALAIFVFLFTFGFIFISPSPSNASIPTPWLHVDGKYIKDPGGNTVVLRGVSLIDIGAIEHQGSFRGGKTAVDLINMATNESSGWYSRVVRLPVYPAAIDGEAGWTNCWYNGKSSNSYYDDHLKAAVEACIAKGVYCIIDWHYIDTYTDKDTQTREFWTFIANKYKDTPNVIFELFNEPTYPDSWSTWRTTAQGWVDMIRTIAPNNLIIVGGPRWSQNLGQAATSPVTGGNIVYNAHYYPTHGGSSAWDANFGNAANSVPFLNTEWGFQHDGDSITTGTVSSYGQAYKDYLETKGISWTAWTFDNDYKPVMFSTRVSSWDLAGSTNNASGDSTYNDHMGQFVKDWLYEKRNSNIPSGSAATAAVTATAAATPTKTATVTATPTKTATPTSTVAATSTSQSSNKILNIQMYNGTTSSSTNGITPKFKLTNIGSSAIDLSTVKIRYYYTMDSSASQSFSVDFASVGSSNITGTFTTVSPSVTGTDCYFEVGFSSSAGTLAAGSSTEIQARYNKSDWSNYNQSNDYSFNPTATAYADTDKVTVYLSGTLNSGTPPSGSGTTVTATPTRTATPVVTPTRTATPVVTPTPTATPVVTPTRTATPVVTPTRTATPVATPTPTVAATSTNSSSASLNIQMFNGNTASSLNGITPKFKLTNTGSTPINLSTVKIRYYYTADSSVSQQFTVDYAMAGNSNITSSFISMSSPTTTADCYLEIGFSSGAGSLAAGASTEIHSRFNKSDWSNYSQTNDYSFNSSATNFVDWTKVTVYLSGTKVSGTEP
ncbi:cellulose binding domain-containing protein [Acetivibrio cellulolyticus]|uniref:cellulose binding domain-containing protein n=1 Tax=Acetivibrio cellulolyticus TaxID=35830 RepID=UPI0001E2CCC7|nr:cellulose binding domain-containing protein [Acetivibrio cellulolyticus]